jgi:Domain of unknown function (DUF4333)
MRHRSSFLTVARPIARACIAIAAVLPIAGCSSRSVADVQKQISKGLNQQLQSEGLSSAEHVSASVTCPRDASLKKGSVFYCDATITKFPPNAPPPPPGSNPVVSTAKTTKRQVIVTIESSNKAHWVLQ